MEIYLQVIFKFSFFKETETDSCKQFIIDTWIPRNTWCVIARCTCPPLSLSCPLPRLVHATSGLVSLICGRDTRVVIRLSGSCPGGVALKGQGLKRPLVPSLQTVPWCVPPTGWLWSFVELWSVWDEGKCRSLSEEIAVLRGRHSDSQWQQNWRQM